MIKHSQSIQSNKFAIPLQNLKKEVMDGVHFLYVDNHQSFKKLALSFLIEVARHVQSTQNRKLVIFLQYIKKVETAFVFYCVAKHSDILQGSSHVRCFLFACLFVCFVRVYLPNTFLYNVAVSYQILVISYLKLNSKL